MDKNYIERIYLEHYCFVTNIVKNTIYSHNKDYVTAVVQDVFLAALQSENLQNHPNIQGWLFVTAKNKSKQWIEVESMRKKRTLNSENFEEIVPDADFSEDVLEKVIFREMMENNIIDKVMKNLTHSERILYHDKYKRNLTNDELAEVYCVTQGIIRTRVSRLKAKIEKILEIERNKLQKL